MIYFDNAATAKPCKESLDAFIKASGEIYGNASSLHGFGIKSEKMVNESKKIILERFSAAYSGDYNLIFTSGGTESNNLAILGCADIHKRDKKRIVSTAIEHESVLAPLSELEKRDYKIIRIAPCSDFETKIINAVDEDTIMLSFIAVNNETGFIIDTEQVYKGVKERHPDCIVHVDAAQAFLKTPVLGDLISVSGHKLHTPKGIGGLFVKKGVRLSNILFGGGQQRGIRSGTVPSELIAAFGAAVKAFKYNNEHMQSLKLYFLQKLKQVDNIIINSTANSLGILNFSVLGVRSEVLVHFLAERGIYVSSGSACGGGKPSHVLRALGLRGEVVDSAIRVSFCMDNTIEQIDEFFIAVNQIIKRLRIKK